MCEYTQRLFARYEDWRRSFKMRTSAAFDLDRLIKDPAVNLELKGTAEDPHNVDQHLDVNQDVEDPSLLQHAAPGQQLPQVLLLLLQRLLLH